MAYRMTAYRGVMRELALAEERDDAPAPVAQARPQPAASQRGNRQVVPATKAALLAEPAFKGIFEFG